MWFICRHYDHLTFSNSMYCAGYCYIRSPVNNLNKRIKRCSMLTQSLSRIESKHSNRSNILINKSPTNN